MFNERERYENIMRRTIHRLERLLQLITPISPSPEKEHLIIGLMELRRELSQRSIQRGNTNHESSSLLPEENFLLFLCAFPDLMID